MKKVTVKKATKVGTEDNLLFLCKKGGKSFPAGLSKPEIAYLKQQLKEDKKSVEVNQYSRRVIVAVIDLSKSSDSVHELARRAGYAAAGRMNTFKETSLTIQSDELGASHVLAAAEGAALGNYQFLKYFTDGDKRKNSLSEIQLIHNGIGVGDIALLSTVVEAVCFSRDLVNEPVSYLTATQLSKEIEALAKKKGFKVEVLRKARIESLKMGGLLAVNKGSVEPPTFNILEWKPAKFKNKKPYVLVGKGIVYDTGGLSLKTTKGSMDQMKCDMSGAAAVVGAIASIAESKLPIHVVGLIPATDNRPGGDAYAPGDVVTMYSGKTVEVLNTDAEGRVVLGDALAYARKYNPELVIDLATLTGAAQRAIGHYASVVMGHAGDEWMEKLTRAGANVHERLVEFPFWDEYGEEIKSDVADIKNTGSVNAGMITAGKFLEHFTKTDKGENAYPWIHIDIAGPAFTEFTDNYRGKGGTGVGVRLLFEFLKNQIQ